jgi:hypothetical protein
MLGDGINVAQRVMSFSAPGQVLVSRSYYEVVSRLSDEYFKLFHYEGPRTDKHVREHEVYAVDAERPPVQRPAPTHQARSNGFAGTAVFDKVSRNFTAVKHSLYRKPMLAATLAVAVLLVAILALLISREQPDKAKADTQKIAAQPVAAPAEKSALVVEKVQPAATKSATTPEDKNAPTVKPAPVATAAPATPAAPAAQAASAAPALPVAQAAPAPPAAAVNRANPGEGTPVSLAVSPWGEVYVDNTMRGVSPPLHNLQLAPGQHKIEIKNTTFPSHVETITVRPGSQITIRHRFAEAE